MRPEKNEFATSENFRARPKLTEVVADDLRRAIVGGMKPGEPLPSEGELTERYGTSIPTVRQALRVLESEGLISIRRGTKGGPVVRYPTVEDITRNVGVFMQLHGVERGELYEARGTLEIAATRLVAALQESAILDELVEHLEIYRQTIEAGDRDAVAAEHLRFHDLLLEHCGNNAMTTLGQITRLIVASYSRESVAGLAADDAGDSIGWISAALAALEAHKEIIDLIRDGNGGGAAERMSEHLARWLEVRPLQNPQAPVEAT